MSRACWRVVRLYDSYESDTSARGADMPEEVRNVLPDEMDYIAQIKACWESSARPPCTASRGCWRSSSASPFWGVHGDTPACALCGHCDAPQAPQRVRSVWPCAVFTLCSFWRCLRQGLCHPARRLHSKVHLPVLEREGGQGQPHQRAEGFEQDESQIPC
eukprot:1083272-Prymnesium_polylepis.2